MIFRKSTKSIEKTDASTSLVSKNNNDTLNIYIIQRSGWWGTPLFCPGRRGRDTNVLGVGYPRLVWGRGLEGGQGQGREGWGRGQEGVALSCLGGTPCPL